MAAVKLFEFGGWVRDGLLGVPAGQIKDKDFAVEAESFDHMKAVFTEQGFQVFLEKREFLTLRAKFPSGHVHSGLGADFVLCHQKQTLLPGSIEQHAAHRDFTVNAMARDAETGELLDFHNGQQDLATRTLRCVGSAQERFSEDPSRALRALRFSLTKGLRFDAELIEALHDPDLSDRIAKLGVEAKRKELALAFKADSLGAIRLIASLPSPLQEAIFADSELWLKATTERA